MTAIPLAASFYWHMPVLLVVVSLVYSATRFDDWPSIGRETVHWIGRMAMFLGGIGLALFVLSLVL